MWRYFYEKRLQGLIVGLLIGIILTSGMSLAKQAKETISVIYDNIKILIDGKEYQTTDANGNVVEPFIYNGTTYLPVRGIANAFGKDVGWNPETMTVSLGSQKSDWLYKLSYIDNQSNFCGNSTFTLEDNGIRLYQSGSSKKYDKFPNQTVAYKLDGNYTSFVATIYNDHPNGSGAKINFYGNNKEKIYSVPALSSKSQSEK